MGEKIEMYPEKKFEKDFIAKAKKYLLGQKKNATIMRGTSAAL